MSNQTNPLCPTIDRSDRKRLSFRYRIFGTALIAAMLVGAQSCEDDQDLHSCSDCEDCTIRPNMTQSEIQERLMNHKRSAVWFEAGTFMLTSTRTVDDREKLIDDWMVNGHTNLSYD